MNVIKNITLLGFIAFLSSCGTSPNSTFYMLNPTSKPTQTLLAKNANLIPIGIEEVTIPSYLNRPQMVTRAIDDSTITVSEFNRWAENLDASLPRLIANAISAKAGYPLAKTVLMNKDAFSYRLYIEIIRFDATFGQNAVLEAWWYLIDSNDKIVYRTIETFTDPAGLTYQSAVDAQSNVVKQLGAQIADYYETNLKKTKK